MGDGLLTKVKGWLPLAAVSVLIIAVVGILWVVQPAVPSGGAVLAEVAPPPQAEPKPTPVPAIVTPPGTEAAPEFRGITAWLNSEPLTMAEQRGKVVLVDIWTYS